MIGTQSLRGARQYSNGSASKRSIRRQATTGGLSAGHQRVQSFIDYQVNQCQYFDVKFLTDTTLINGQTGAGDDASGSVIVLSQEFDHVIVAVGAQKRTPDWLQVTDDDNGVTVLSAVEQRDADSALSTMNE